MTKRLADKIGMSSTDIVLDAACGLGESVRYLEAEYGCSAFGMDLSRGLVHGTRSLRQRGNAGFLIGDGEQLPIRDNAFTAVISECSMCLMPRFDDGLSEVLRILKPGGRIGITDITIDGEIPSDLQDVLTRFLCISHSISWAGYPEALLAQGFRNVEVTDETRSLGELLEVIRKRLLVAELLTAIGKLSVRKEQLDRGKRLVSLAKIAVERKNLKYAMLTGQKPHN